MRADGLNVHGIQTAAGSHEQAIAAWAAEAHIAAHFRQHDLANAFALG
jgi:ribose 5-phosphate isomerase RpiB